MNNLRTINDVLNFAIESEQKAFNLYTKLANQSKNTEMQETFLKYASDAMRHKIRLDNIKKNKELSKNEGRRELRCFHPNEYKVPNTYSRDINYDDALKLAMKREKAGYKLYNTLAKNAPNTELKNLFLSLAKDDANHKLHFEIEYENFVKQ